MSFVIAAPDLVAMATEDLAGIGASLTAANAAAAVPTSGLLAAAGDEVSAAIAALFSSHGQQYQAMSAQAAAFHARFVQALAGAMGAYAAAEAANASPLQTLEQGLLGAINAPAAALSGRPFIGNGTNGAPGTGWPLAPLPISGRPVAAWMGALNTSIRLCNGDAAAISATA